MKLEDYIYGLIKHPRKYGLEDKELYYFESESARVIYGAKAKGGLYIIKDIDYIESDENTHLHIYLIYHIIYLCESQSYYLL